MNRSIASLPAPRSIASRLLGIAAALIVTGAASWPLQAAAEMLRAGGTGAALGTMRLLGDAYAGTDPQTKLEIVPNLGSSGGLKALDRGAIHFAVIGRALSPEETAKGFFAVEYGRTAFVFATSRRGVGSLTLAQIADIYSGNQAKWPDGTPIRLVLRPANDSDTAMLATLSPAMKVSVARANARDGMVVGITDQDSADQIARLPGAFGTSTLALMLSEKRAMHAVAIEGVMPSAKAVADGTYPYSKPLFMVTRGAPAGALARFVDFVRSAEGRRILTDTGHVLVGVKSSGKAFAR